jgi:hypothetical protein
MLRAVGQRLLPGAPDVEEPPMDMPNNPDALAKKFFLILLFSVFAYVSAVIMMIAPPDRADQGETPATSVATAH